MRWGSARRSKPDSYGPSSTRVARPTESWWSVRHEHLNHAQIAEAKGLLGELNTLSTVVTRTRKAEIDEDKTVREPMIVDVRLTDAERQLYDAVYEWQLKRAAAREIHVYFIGQMILRLAGSCLQATRSHVLARGAGGSFEVPTDEDGLVDDSVLFGEDAADALNVLDDAVVDGFADDVIRSGRYVGQPELVWLLEDWAATAPGAACRRTDEGGRPLWLHFRGNAELAENLLGVQAEGERSASEIEALRTLLQNEMDIPLCLDQETARRQGADLLNANHPLVRAALRTPHSGQTRFGALGIATADVEPGVYLVLVAVAHWKGVRPAAELWTAATDRTGRPVGPALGDALLAALAEAALIPSRHTGDWGERHVLVCRGELESRHTAEDKRRRAENERMILARRISIEESFDRKVADIDKRIQTLRDEGKPATIPMFESQRRTQDYRRSQALHTLEQARAGSLELEYVALCALEVSP